MRCVDRAEGAPPPRCHQSAAASVLSECTSASMDQYSLELPSVQCMIMLRDWMRLHETVISGTCASSRHFAMEFRMEFRDLLLPNLAASPALSSRSLESATIACAEWNARCSFSILSLIPCKAASAVACEGGICTLRRTDSRQRLPVVRRKTVTHGLSTSTTTPIAPSLSRPVRSNRRPSLVPSGMQGVHFPSFR